MSVRVADPLAAIVRGRSPPLIEKSVLVALPTGVPHFERKLAPAGCGLPYFERDAGPARAAGEAYTAMRTSPSELDYEGGGTITDSLARRACARVDPTDAFFAMSTPNGSCGPGTISPYDRIRDSCTAADLSPEARECLRRLSATDTTSRRRLGRGRRVASSAAYRTRRPARPYCGIAVGSLPSSASTP